MTGIGRTASIAPAARSVRRRWFAAMAMVVLTITGGCAVEVSPPKGDCSPSYEAPSEYGSFSAQQPGPGAPIQWGIYPNYPASHFVVDVLVGSRRVDHKDQNYPPHGSVSATDVRGRSGQDLTVSGQIADPQGNTLNFQLKCIIA